MHCPIPNVWHIGTAFDLMRFCVQVYMMSDTDVLGNNGVHTLQSITFVCDVLKKTKNALLALICFTIHSFRTSRIY